MSVLLMIIQLLPEKVSRFASKHAINIQDTAHNALQLQYCW